MPRAKGHYKLGLRHRLGLQQPNRLLAGFVRSAGHPAHPWAIALTQNNIVRKQSENIKRREYSRGTLT